MQQVAVFGSSGFLGTHLSEKLKTRFDIYPFNSKDYDFTDSGDQNDFILDDIPSTHYEYVYVCSAKVGGIKANIDAPYDFLYDNLQIQNFIINHFKESSTKKVIFLGSSCIYPKDYQQPLKEEYLLQAPLEPTNEGYALAKICGLKLCEYANKQFKGTRFISLMPCNLYGPGDNFSTNNSHVLSALIKKICHAKFTGKNTVEIWGSGNQKREFLFVKDLVDAMVWATDNLDGSEGIVNIGTGVGISIKDLACLIADMVEYKGKFLFDDSKPEGMKEKTLDVSKAERLGWKAKTSLEEGVKQTIDYYWGNLLKK